MNGTARILLTIALLATLPIFAFAKGKKPPGTKVSWKEVPAAVQTTIQSNAAGGKVAEVTKETINGVLWYSAEVKGTDGTWTKVHVTEAGTLMKVEPDKARNKRKHKPLFGNESSLGPAPFA